MNPDATTHGPTDAQASSLPRAPRRRSALELSVALAMGLLLLVSGCSSSEPIDYTPKSITVDTNITTATPETSLPAGYPQLGGTGPGALLSVENASKDLPQIVETGASAWRITYRSPQTTTSATDEVRALVAIPGGEPPKGGWPVVAYNHGNTGVNYNCGPTLYADLMNQSIPIEAFLKNGFVVVATDYAGISGDPASPGLAFLDAPSMGRDVVNGVRATRRMSPDIGKRWALAGGSLGGAATWGANSIVGDEDDIKNDLVAAAAWVPVVNVSGLVDKAEAGTLTIDQRHLYFLTILQLQRTLHPEMNLRDYMRGSFYDNRALLTECTGPRLNEAIQVIDSADPKDLIPASQPAAAQMKSWLDALRPEPALQVPMVVVYGDSDKLVDYKWIEGAIDRACAANATIEWEKRPGEGHDNINASWVFAWMRGQFDGQKPTNMCASAPIKD